MNNHNLPVEQISKDILSAIDHIGGDINMKRYRPTGITFSELRDCYIRAIILSYSFYKEGTLERCEPNATLIEEANKGEYAALCESDISQLVGNCDLLALQQNISCEVEKFKNMRGAKEVDTELLTEQKQFVNNV